MTAALPLLLSLALGWKKNQLTEVADVHRTMVCVGSVRRVAVQSGLVSALPGIAKQGDVHGHSEPREPQSCHPEPIKGACAVRLSFAADAPEGLAAAELWEGRGHPAAHYLWILHDGGVADV
jgi:hypothetical protein